MSEQSKLSVVEAQAKEQAMPSPPKSLIETLRESKLISYWQEEWKALAVIVGVFLLCYYIPVGNARFDNAVNGSVPSREVVRTRTCLAVPSTRFFHSRRDRRLCEPGRRHEVLGAPSVEVDFIPGRFSIRHSARRLFLHGVAPLCRHLDPWGGVGACVGISLFRTGDQRACHHSDCSYPWL